MNDSSLDAALKALRADLPAPGDDGEATRQRVLRSVHRAALWRRRVRTTVLTSAVALIGGLALAHFIARPTPAASPSTTSPKQPLGSASSAEPPKEPSAEQPGAQDHDLTLRDGETENLRPSNVAASPTRQSARVVSQASRGRPEKAAAPAQEEPRSESEHETAVSSLPATPEPSSEPAAPAPIPAAELQGLYATAHRLQFRGAPRQALAAWDAYLAHGPTGAVAAEARFNRAITLVRLGLQDEARSALEPFVRGEHGALRQADARQLLKTLR